MKSLWIIAVGATLALTSTAFAAGDVAKGEKTFKKCKSCHTIANGDDVIVKGGRTGPNLFGVIGRAAGSEDFKYSKSMLAAGSGGLVWSEEEIATYVVNPNAYLSDLIGESAKSKMTFKLKKGGEDVAAYLASLAE